MITRLCEFLRSTLAMTLFGKPLICTTGEQETMSGTIRLL